MNILETAMNNKGKYKCRENMITFYLSYITGTSLVPRLNLGLSITSGLYGYSAYILYIL